MAAPSTNKSVRSRSRRFPANFPQATAINLKAGARECPCFLVYSPDFLNEGPAALKLTTATALLGPSPD